MKRFDTMAWFGDWPCWRLPQQTPEELIALMDRHDIERAAVMSLRGMILDWRAGNAETLEAARRYPDRLVPVATLCEFLGGGSDVLTRLFDEGFRGVRLVPLFHNYPLDSEWTDAICDVAASYQVPVVIPTRPMMNWRFRTLPLETIEPVVARHPATSFILSGPNYLVEFQALVALMKHRPHVSYEISCLQGHGALARLVAAVGAERVLFGTGAVLQYPACNVAKLNHAELADDQRRAIAWDNGARLWGEFT